MRALISVSVLAFCAISLAHDEPLTGKQRAELKAVRPRLEGPLRAEQAKALRRALSSFTVAELREIEHHAEFGELTEDEKGYLRHAVAAIAFATEHEQNLRDPWPAALLLGSPMWSDWLEAVRLLEKEDFSEGLERVAVSMAADPRPQVRVGAGRLAKALTRFRGSSPACTAIAKRLLTDEIPNVTMMFGAFDAQDFRDKDLTDLAVSRLRDRRNVESIPGITPWGEGGTVAAAIANRLYGEMMHLYGGLSLGADPADDVGAIERWWKQNRDRYDYGMDPKKWELVGEWRGKCRKGEEAEVKLKEGRAWFTVLGYSEYSANGRPLHDVTVRLRPDEVPLEKVGQATSKLREDIERGLSSSMVDGERCAFDYFVVPDQAGDFRVSVRVWKGRKSP